MFRTHVVSAVFWRNVKQYFSSVLGYLFIVVFVTVCAVLAFNQKFFADNLANLDQLSNWFPLLLLFIVPAITMTVWADEKKQGTDAILFTLPASDFEITLGKFLSVAAVYTIALLFSMTQLIALKLIGDPDWGVIVATYLGYWLCGLALLSIGMFASSLTESPTVAFVLGTIMCAVPVLIGQYFRGAIWLERIGISWNLEDFTAGLIPLANVVYFVSIIVLMVYLNLVVISKRHWRTSESGSLAGHYFLRIACLVVALISLNYVARSWSSSDWTRADLTAEKLFTLDKATLETIKKAKENKRPVTIQAFVSKEVPRKYVNARKQFLGLLRQYDYYGGNYVDLRLVSVKPNSPQEDEAIKLGVEPIEDRSEVGGRMVEQRVFLGAHVSSSIDDGTLPAIDANTPMEYELTRVIASTTDKSRKLTIGILDTDARFGCQSVDGEQFGEWWTFTTTMRRLKNHFKIKHFTQAEFPEFAYSLAEKDSAEETTEDGTGENAKNGEDEPGDGDETGSSNEAAEGETESKPKKEDSPKVPDVLIVADPASLDQPSSDALLEYIAAGHAVIVLSDPLPFYLTYEIPGLGLINAPLMPRFPAQHGAARFLSSSPMPKADASCSSLHKALGLEVTMGDVAWNLANPHPNYNMPWRPEYGNQWPTEAFGPYDQVVNFVRADQDLFDSESDVTSGIREMLFFYPGSIKADPENKELEFNELISLGSQSGTTPWKEIVYTPTRVTRGMDRTGRIVTDEVPYRSRLTNEPLMTLNPNAPNRIDEESYAVAAHIRGVADEEGNRKNKTNLIYVADTDFLSEMYYAQEKELEQPLDNFVFLLNAIEVLTGKENLVALRNRRPVLRTLSGFEKQIDSFRQLRAVETKKVEKRIRQQREAAEKELEEVSRDIQEDESLGVIQQAQMFSQKRSDALDRLERKMDKLNDELEDEIQTLKSQEQQQISTKESQVRWLSVLLAPLPALLLGIVVLTVRSANEKRTIDPRRRVGAHDSTNEVTNHG